MPWPVFLTNAFVRTVSVCQRDKLRLREDTLGLARNTFVGSVANHGFSMSRTRLEECSRGRRSFLFERTTRLDAVSRGTVVRLTQGIT